MRAYFINLDREPARRAHMEQALLGLDCERVAAVDGRLRPATEKGLTRFELACLESHRAAWTQFLATPAPFACFLEDDVHFAPEFPVFLNSDDWIPPDAHAVKLDTFFQPVMLGATQPTLKGRELALLFTRHESCAAYILSRRGAELFLDATQAPELPVDYIVFPEDPQKSGLRLYQLTPAAAIQDALYLAHYDQGLNFATGISRLDVVKPKAASQKLAFTFQREARRLWLQIFKARRYAVNRLLRGLRPEIIPFR